jgi:hypothetical protein
MESSAFLSPPAQIIDERRGESDLQTLEFVAGHEIRVTTGQLAGVKGVMCQQSVDGRWIIELADMLPGVFLCVDARQIACNN